MKEQESTRVNQETGGNNEKLSMKVRMAWPTSALSLSLSVIFVSYISFYATDMVGLDASIVGILLLLSKVVDMVTDLGIGFLIDKTNTRFGKARPYELAIIFLWIFIVLLFSIPNVGKTLQYTYLFIMYTLVNAVCVTCLTGNGPVYLARAVPSEKNRMTLLSFTGFVSYVIAIAFTMIFPQIMVSVGTTKHGWFQIALGMAVIFGILGILRFFFVPEVVTDHEDKDFAKKEKRSSGQIGVMDTLKALLKNKYLFILAGMILCCNIVNNVGTATTYYFQYIVGDLGIMSFIAISSFVTPVFLAFFPALARKFTTTGMLRGCMLIGVVGLAVRTLGGPNIATIFIGNILFNISMIPLNSMMATYIIDCMDYGEWKTGLRIEGPVASINGFAVKMGGAIAVGLTGIIMGAAGYDGTLAVQSASANTAIIATYNWIPLILVIITFILALSYKMDKEIPQMKADLAKRHNSQE